MYILMFYGTGDISVRGMHLEYVLTRILLLNGEWYHIRKAKELIGMRSALATSTKLIK